MEIKTVGELRALLGQFHNDMPVVFNDDTHGKVQVGQMVEALYKTKGTDVLLSESEKEDFLRDEPETECEQLPRPVLRIDLKEVWE